MAAMIDGTYEHTTEWDEILQKHGIKEKPPVSQEEMDDLLDEATKLAIEDAKTEQYENQSLEELAEKEDEIEESELARLRRLRMEEMKEKKLKDRYGEVFSITADEYIKQVSEASNLGEGLHVVCLLNVPGNEDCSRLHQYMRVCASKFKAVKFVVIKASDAVKNYPDKQGPTVLVYYKGDVLKTLQGIGSFGGAKANALSVEWTLAELGCIQTELTQDPLQDAMKLNRIDKSNIKQRSPTHSNYISKKDAVGLQQQQKQQQEQNQRQYESEGDDDDFWDD